MCCDVLGVETEQEGPATHTLMKRKPTLIVWSSWPTHGDKEGNSNLYGARGKVRKGKATSTSCHVCIVRNVHEVPGVKYLTKYNALV